MSIDWFGYPNRTLCACLQEMRDTLKAKDPKCVNRSCNHLRGLIEEVQTYANRMEAALEDQRDIREAHEKKKELKEEIKTLRKQLKELEKKKDA